MRVRIKKFIDYLYDWREDVQERLFMLLTVIALSGMVFAMIGGLFIGENASSLLYTLIAFLVFAVITYLGYRYHRIRLVANILAVLLVFGFFPLVFFTSGGIYGGSPIWFMFSVLFVGMILRGKLRIIFLASEFVIAAACYYIQYIHPEYVIPHNMNEFYMDSYGTFVIVSLLCTLLINFQTYVYRKENEMAKAQKEEIDQLSKAQNRFFSSMSHEIRTPINTIIGLNEMIMREEISDEVAEDARNIQAASRLLVNLINDILDMSRIQSGQMKLTLAPYSPAELIYEVVSMMQVRADEKGLQFDVVAYPDIPQELYGDEVRIKQILINVLNNAIKYTEEGQVTISARCERRGDDAFIIYSVSDTGIGIKKESIPHLFTAFRRVDEERNKYIEGAGLGLSIVKELVDLMGGSIKVNSLYNKGSTFIIEIPQKIVNDADMGELDVKKLRSSSGSAAYHQSFEAPEANVLVVDDTPTNLLVVSKLLRDTKVRLDTAGSGAEALQKTLDKEYHVIFMDHLMPAMDGIECMHKIRTQTGGLCRESKIVALTANAGREDRARYEREGFDGYMMKPVKGETLENELRRLLPKKLITMEKEEVRPLDETVSWIQTESNKRPVVISSSSVLDIPKEFVDKYHIEVIPAVIETENGCFRDAIDIDTGALMSYMEDNGREAKIRKISTEEFESFFGDVLENAENVIHISVSSRITDTSYLAAVDAKKTYDNVTVVDTLQISTGLGMMVLEAGRLADEGKSVREITERLDEMKDEIKTTFIADKLDNLTKGRQVWRGLILFTSAFMIRPVLVLKNGRMTIKKVHFGARERAWKRYISETLTRPDTIDKSRIFVTHVGLSQKDLDFIRSEIEKKVSFEKIYFEQAAAGIAVYVGTGTFGIFFRRKG